MSDIIYIKLISGEEIIAKLIKSENNEFTVKSARTIHVMNHNGQAAASFIPTMMFHDDNQYISIWKSSVAMLSYKVSDEYERRYLEAVSGIQLAGNLRG